MKTVLFAFFIFIFSPHAVFSASFDDVKGYWLSEEEYPMIGHKVTLIITENTLRHRKLQPEKITVEQKGDNFIIRFNKLKKSSKMYEKSFYKISFINTDKILVEKPVSDGKFKGWVYNRITEEEAQKYLK